MKLDRAPRYRLPLGLATLVVISGLGAVPASGAASASGDRIVFERGQDGSKDIYSMNADGSDVQQLTTDPGDEYGAAWSPDRSKIAFWRTSPGDPLGQVRALPELLIMSPDGSDQEVIWTGSGTAHDHARWAPSWSPDGTTIAFESNIDQTEGTSIYTIRSDGSLLRRVTRNNEQMIDVAPAWAPDAKRIYFTRQDWSDPEGEPQPTFQIFSVRPDGTGLKALTSDPTYHWGPKPSPDGKRILFTRGDKEMTYTHIFIMKADGSSMRRVTQGPEFDFWASWGPDGKRLVFTRDPDGSTGARGCVIEPGPEANCYYRTGPLPADIFTLELGGSDLQQLSDDIGHEGQPSFTP